MDIHGNVVIRIDAGEQTDQWLIDSVQEIRKAAEARGLEIPAFAGTVALDGAAETEVKPEVTPETRESIAEQLPTALKGHINMVDALNNGRRKKDQIEAADAEGLETEFILWLTDEKVELVNEMKEANPDVTFTLVATPNVLADTKDVTKAAKAFGKDQPYETYVWDELYGKYTAEQLSGTNHTVNDKVVFSLIPSSLAPELEGTVEQQRAKLAELQKADPALKVPSVLEAVTYWATLRAQGDKLADGTTFDKTYIRHFDLPEQRFDGWLDVPRSFVRGDGEPRLSGSDAQGGGVARVAVG